MLRVIEDPKLCEKRNVDGMYLIDAQAIVVADKNDKGVLVHEISHYLYSIGSTKYFDSILDICALLDIDFWDVVDIEAVSCMVGDYEVLMDELCAYFVEEVYMDFPEVILQSHPVYRIILEKEVI